MKVNGNVKKIDIEKHEQTRQTVVKRAAVDVLGNEDEIRTKNSEVVLKDIPIDLIKNREENKYILSNIEELANSIQEIGLQQAIVVRIDKEADEERYVVVAGHRRITAYRYLRDKFLKKYGNEKHNTVLLYSYIRARVLTPDEELVEEKIYNHTNDKARDGLTPFEKLLRFDLDAIDMDNEETRKEYLLALHGEDEYKKYLQGNSKVKFNQSARYAYIHHLVKTEFKDETTTLSTIKSYVSMIQSSSSELIAAVLAGKIPLREAKGISMYPKEQQIVLINEDTPQETKDSIIKESKASSAIELENEEKVFNYDVFVKQTKRLEKMIAELSEGVSTLNKKEMNGNQKEYIKQFGKIVKDFKALENLEIK